MYGAFMIGGIGFAFLDNMKWTMTFVLFWTLVLGIGSVIFKYEKSENK